VKYHEYYFKQNHSNYQTCKNSTMVNNIYFPLAILSENITPPSRVLDVGCALGFFLKYCDLYGLNTYGVDISKYAIDESKKVTEAELFVHDIDNGFPMFEDNFFDLITVFDVIEHLNSPYNLVNELYRICKKNGKLIITTPNINALGRIISRKNWHGFKDQTHLYLFTQKSLEHLVEKAGFKVIRSYTPFHPLPKNIQKLVNRTGLGGQIWLVCQK